MKLYNLICPICGEKFIGMKKQKYCSDKCADSNWNSVRRIWRKNDKSRKSEDQLRRDRLAARDAAYAAAFPDLASGSVRGRIAAGGRCGVIRDESTGELIRKYISPSHTN